MKPEGYRNFRKERKRMDTNGMPIEGFYSTNVPAGLGIAPPLSANLQTPVREIEKAAGYVEPEAVTESEMEHLIMEYKAARSAKEAEAVLKDKVKDGQMDKVLGGLEEDFFS